MSTNLHSRESTLRIFERLSQNRPIRDFSLEELESALLAVSISRAWPERYARQIAIEIDSKPRDLPVGVSELFGSIVRVHHPEWEGWLGEVVEVFWLVFVTVRPYRTPRGRASNSQSLFVFRIDQIEKVEDDVKEL